MIVGVTLAGNLHAAASCTGGDNCTVCTNCNYCKHCNEDRGTCGVKKGISLGKGGRHRSYTVRPVDHNL
jgi:hypothetical protein